MLLGGAIILFQSILGVANPFLANCILGNINDVGYVGFTTLLIGSFVWCFKPTPLVSSQKLQIALFHISEMLLNFWMIGRDPTLLGHPVKMLEPLLLLSLPRKLVPPKLVILTVLVGLAVLTGIAASWELTTLIALLLGSTSSLLKNLLVQRELQGNNTQPQDLIPAVSMLSLLIMAPFILLPLGFIDLSSLAYLVLDGRLYLTAISTFTYYVLASVATCYAPQYAIWLGQAMTFTSIVYLWNGKITMIHLSLVILVPIGIKILERGHVMEKVHSTAHGDKQNNRTPFLLYVGIGLLFFSLLFILLASKPMAMAKAEIPSALSEDISNDISRSLCLKKAKRLVYQTITSFIQPGQPIALLNLPIHWNLGDSFIWIGEKIIFELYGQAIVSIDDDIEFNLEKLAKVIKQGTIFLHGGGNFGDVWRHMTEKTYDVLEKFPNNKVVWLPESIYYSNLTLAKLDNEAFSKHKDFTVLARDDASLQIVREHLPDVKSILCLDSAFAIEETISVHDPVVDVILLMRSDLEAVITKRQTQDLITSLEKQNITVELWDWPVKEYFRNPHTNQSYELLAPNYGVTEPLDKHDLLRLKWGLSVQLFSRGKLVITDRLHASILATLMHKPVIYLDNMYGKIHNVRSTLSAMIPECTEKALNGYPINNITESIPLAKKILEQFTTGK